MSHINPYQQSQSLSQSPLPPASFIGDTSRLCEGLSEVISRIIKIGDHLNGPHPREAGIAPSGQPNMPNLRHNIDQALAMLDMAHSELTRIEARL